MALDNTNKENNMFVDGEVFVNIFLQMSVVQIGQK